MSKRILSSRTATLIGAAALAVCFNAPAKAQAVFAFLTPPPQATAVQPQEQVMVDEEAEGTLDPRLARQVVDYRTSEAPGTIVIDTPNTYLYYVLGNGKAVRYGIGVGREGFTWSGVKTVARKAEWPDWYPPQEMIDRQPYLPRMTAGGPGNPLGARAMYLGGTVYRIHGTNNPATIGKQVSSGCIRMTNEDVQDLYERVKVGTKVVVLPMAGPATAQRRLEANSYAPAVPSRAQGVWATIR
ncbi:MAG: L,D-transpeptidase [Pseudolabrys sp.]|nr:L,D-transpeptidase [Pseudolabrys sp.]